MTEYGRIKYGPRADDDFSPRVASIVLTRLRVRHPLSWSTIVRDIALEEAKADAGQDQADEADDVSARP